MTISPFIQAAITLPGQSSINSILILVLGAAGFWAAVKAFIKLAESKGDNASHDRTDVNELIGKMMVQQQAAVEAAQTASDRATARSDAEIERLHQRMITTDQSNSARSATISALFSIVRISD